MAHFRGGKTFSPFLQGMGCDPNEMLFQDGAWSYTANTVLDILNSHFLDRIISNCYLGRSRVRWPWLRYCSYINPYDDFFRIMSIAVVLNVPQI
jgi:hypothetical protein